MLKKFAMDLNKKLQATTFIVGGMVRDAILGVSNKDIDLEVFGVEPQALLKFLEKNNYSPALEPNAKFPVIRIRLEGEEVEIGFPRRDNKVGEGHSGFEVSVDPNMSLPAAAKRRDFTFNSMYKNVLTDEIVDPFGGKEDLLGKVIRPTDPETFREDPLRIMRAAQFIARFELDSWGEVLSAIDKNMAKEFRQIDPSSIWLEFNKLLTKGTPRGINLATQFLGDVSKKFGIFPIFSKLRDCPQNPLHHQEGDVLIHTGLVAESLFAISSDVAIRLSAIAHDMGKPAVLGYKDNQPTAYGHEKANAEMLAFLKAIGCPKKITRQVLLLTQKHMLPLSMKMKKWCRLADELDHSGLTLANLMTLKLADTLGSINDHEGLVEKHAEAVDKFRNTGIFSSPLPKLIDGKTVMQLTGAKGPEIGKKLELVRNMQFAGQLQTREDAIKFLGGE